MDTTQKTFFAIRWRTALDGGRPASERIFAAAELVCLPVSIATFAYVVAEVIFRRVFNSDLLTPADGLFFARWALPILTAAAIGYIVSCFTVKALLIGIRRKGPELLSKYLKTTLPGLLENAIASPKLQPRLGKTRLKGFRELIGTRIAEKGAAMLASIDFPGKVESAVNALNMKDFQIMLDHIMAPHLSAIQVLGYVLGAVVGALQCL